MIYNFILPCYAQLGKKRIPLNLNWYRNAHYRALSEIKKQWQPVKYESFTGSLISVHYVFHRSGNRRTDASNWISVTDKFFLDWLVNNCMIPDDDCTHYTASSWEVAKTIEQNYIVAMVEVV